MSHKNYYEILEIPRQSTQEEISNAFRRLSLKYHPKRNSSKDFAVNNFFFHEIAEAYEVLSDPNKRGVYDIYGVDGLKNGIVDKNKNLKGGHKYGGNSYEVFEKFFGTANPFSIIKDHDKIDDEFGSMFGAAFGGLHEVVPESLKNVELDIECTLEELYNGGVKRFKYTRKVVNIDGRTTSEKEETRDVEIFKGYGKDTVLTFTGVGNETPARINSDLVLKIKEKPNKNYKRNNNDLIYTHKISLVDALNTEPFSFQTLDGRTLTIAMDEIISPQSCKTIQGEGMPIHNKNDLIENILTQEKKGNLYVKFHVIFPTFIEPEKKEELVKLLKEAETDI